MKALLAFIVFFLSSNETFAERKACAYAGSNIGFVKTQTENAISARDLKQSKYFAYKALNAIEKSREQMEECGCKYAYESILESLDKLKQATRVTSLGAARILLNRALEHTLGSLDALEQHEELHQSEYASDILAMNTVESEENKRKLIQPQGKELQNKIDLFLEDYRNSLNNVIKSLDCEEAYAYAIKVFEHCEQQLLKEKLTEAKKYYNLKTKEITEEALKKLNGCAK